MKKIISITIAALAIVMLASCTSVDMETPDFEIDGQNVADMPDWIFNDVSTSRELKVTGRGHMSTIANSIKMAEADARMQMTQFISLDSDTIVTAYASDAGSGSNREAYDAFENVGKQSASSVLKNSKREKLWIAEDGTVYVLMSVPFEGASERIEEKDNVTAASIPDSEASAEALARMEKAVSRNL